MGRRKITIEPIQDDRSRQVTFTKRKNGLMKKAMELSVLCNCRIGLILFDGNGKLYDFKTEDMTTLVTDYFARDVYESNDKETLFRRYNAKEAPTLTEQVPICDDPKLESLLGEVDKTDETVVDVESNSEGAADVGQTIPEQVPAGKRRKVHAPITPKRENSNERDVGRGPPLQHPCSGWCTFSARPAYLPETVFTGGIERRSMCNCDRRFKEEPYSAAQQILRLEDTPSFLMSIPRQPHAEGMYGMPIPSAPPDCAQHQSMYLANSTPPASGPFYLLNNPETSRKVVDVCETFKNPNLTSTLMSTPRIPRMSPQSEMQSMHGQGHFPYFNNLADMRPPHLGMQQHHQFPIEDAIGHNAITDVQQDAMFLQSLLRPPAPPYTFPSSASHCPSS